MKTGSVGAEKICVGCLIGHFRAFVNMEEHSIPNWVSEVKYEISIGFYMSKRRMVKNNYHKFLEYVQDVCRLHLMVLQTDVCYLGVRK